MEWIKKCKEHFFRKGGIVRNKSGNLTWSMRAIILLFFLAIAQYLTFVLDIPGHLSEGRTNDHTLAYSITILLFGITFGIGGWIIRTHDKKKEFENVFQQQNETLFSNALQLLFKKDDKIANSIGLKELIQLKQTGTIDSKRIDLITSSRLELEGVWLYNANLSGANLFGAKLQNAVLIGVKLIDVDLCAANLCDANLSVTELHNTNLCSANLSKIKYSDRTKFSGVKYNDKTLEYIKDNQALIDRIKKEGTYQPN